MRIGSEAAVVWSLVNVAGVRTLLVLVTYRYAPRCNYRTAARHAARSFVKRWHGLTVPDATVYFQCTLLKVILML